jgi:putative ABC transport system ATP-binding protein
MLIKIRNLTKTYKMDGNLEIKALQGITLNIDYGEFVAIMGPSGSGKTTLMNIIGCLDKYEDGEYFLEGVDIKKLSEEEISKIRNKKIGFVFQSFNLLPGLSVIENVEIPLIYSMIYTSRNIEEFRSQTVEILKQVGLANRLKHLPNQLSGGEKQRVAIARALVNNPSLILADEPTGNLDSKTSYEIMELFKRINEEGMTIILVTHDKDIASYAKRILTIKDGYIISDERKEQ